MSSRKTQPFTQLQLQNVADSQLGIQFLSKETGNLFPTLNEGGNPSQYFRSKWAGIRPLVLNEEVSFDQSQESHSGKDFSRKHLIIESNSGLISVMGGKWTIYRRMGEETLLHILKRQNPELTEIPEEQSTRNLRFIGDFRDKTASKTKVRLRKEQESHVRSLVKELYASHTALGLPLLNHLVRAYGIRSLDIIDLIAANPKLSQKIHPDFEVTHAEVVYQIRTEMVVSVHDLLLRRNRLAFLDKNAALDSLPMLVELLGSERGWDVPKKQAVLTDSKIVFEKMEF